MSEELYCTINFSRVKHCEGMMKADSAALRKKIEEEVRNQDEKFRVKAFIKDRRSPDRLRILCRNEEELKNVKPAAVAIATQGARVLRDQLYPVKINNARPQRSLKNYLTRLSPEDGAKLFRTRLGHATYDHADVSDLVELLEGLPLALSQAASYIATCSISVDKYICLYRGSEAARIKLLQEGGFHDDGSIENPVARTWLVSFERIRQESAFAAHLLCFAACLHHSNIPMDILPDNEDEVKIMIGLGILKAHCLISKESSADRFDMHSLVHLVTRYWLQSTCQLDRYIELAFDAILERLPLEIHSQIQIVQGNRYSSHAQALLFRQTLPKRGEAYAETAFRLSRYLHVKGDYQSALLYSQQAVDTSIAVRGPEALDTLTRKAELCVIKLYLGKYQEANELATQVLHIRKDVLGDEHEETLSIQNNLALICYYQGEYIASESLQRQTFETRERTLGTNHHDTLKSLNNLGLVLNRLERLEEAETAFRKALRERELTLSENDTHTLAVISNLGLVLELRGKYEDALQCHRTALIGREVLFGPMHPESLKSKQNMAVILTKQGSLDEAESETRAVLKGYTALALGDLPDVFYAQQCLVEVLEANGKVDEAERMSQQVFEARRAKLGEDHPETIFSRLQWEWLKDNNGAV